MSEWKEYKLGDIVLDVAMGPFGSNLKADNFISSGVPVIRGSNLNDGGFEDDKFVFVSDAKAKSLKRSLAYPDELIFTHRGTLGQVAIIPKDKHPYYLVSQSQMRVDVNREYLVPRYLLYWFKSRTGQYELLKNSAQVGVPSIASPTKSIKEIDLKIPTVNTQNRIVEILSCIDDKIELNNNISKELEKLAQTLFKQWFVDFEFPDQNGESYQSSGGEMVESELGMIPKGWGIYSISDLLETVSKTYPLKTVDSVIFLNTGDIQDGKFLHNNISDTNKLPGQAKKSIAENDILYSEIRPANKRFAYVHFDTSKYVVSTKLMVLRSKVAIHSYFQYFILTQDDKIQHLQRLAESRSGTFPQITFSEVSTIKIALPSFNLVNDFVDKVLKPFYDFKFNCVFENEDLTNLRDTLLPKLISGELNVKDL